MANSVDLDQTATSLGLHCWRMPFLVYKILGNLPYIHKAGIVQLMSENCDGPHQVYNVCIWQCTFFFFYFSTF